MKVVDRKGNIVIKGENQNQTLRRLYGTFLGRCALKVLVSKWVTNLGGWYMNTRFSRRRIAPFIVDSQIDMSMYEERDFVSYNDFFTRKIKEGKRPINLDKDVFVSPADSKLSYYDINEQTILTIKDTKYTITDLLEDADLANEYQGGICLIFRLTVDDYHRYSYVDNGTFISKKYIPGKFHTVNPIANDYYPIYKQNAREYSVLKTDNFGTIIQMEVGAMMVGKIVNHQHQTFIKGQEKGMFEFGGSTVVILLKKDIVEIDQDIRDNTKQDRETVVSLGETIGKKIRRENDE